MYLLLEMILLMVRGKKLHNLLGIDSEMHDWHSAGINDTIDMRTVQQQALN